MPATLILEIQLAPDVKTLLEKLITVLPSKNVSCSQPLPPQSPAEQAARMRVQQAPVPIPRQPAPTYSPRNPCPPTVSQMYPQRSGNPVNQTPQPAYPPQSAAPVNPTPAPTAAPMQETASVNGSSTAPQAASHSNTAPVSAAPTYELDQLARATATLADAGKAQQIQQLFQQFSIQQLTALPKKRYGEYATALRQMGVRI